MNNKLTDRQKAWGVFSIGIALILVLAIAQIQQPLQKDYDKIRCSLNNDELKFVQQSLRQSESFFLVFVSIIFLSLGAGYALIYKANTGGKDNRIIVLKDKRRSD